MLKVQVRLVPRQLALLGVVQPHRAHVLHHLPSKGHPCYTTVGMVCGCGSDLMWLRLVDHLRTLATTSWGYAALCAGRDSLQATYQPEVSAEVKQVGPAC